MDLIDCNPKNPLRPVAWRWKRAETLRAAHVAPEEGRADSWIARAMAYQAAWEQLPPECRLPDDELGREALHTTVPDIAGAHALWLRDDSPVRWELEARLLTEQSYAAIEARLGVCAGTVAAYEALFYSVRDRLKARSYILHVAIGPVLSRGLSPRHVDVFWKVFAYKFGPRMLDALVEPLEFAADAGGGSLDIPSLVAAVTGDLLTLKSIVAAWTVRLDSDTCLPMIRCYQRHCEHQLRLESRKAQPAEKATKPSADPVATRSGSEAAEREADAAPLPLAAAQCRARRGRALVGHAVPKPPASRERGPLKVFPPPRPPRGRRVARRNRGPADDRSSASVTTPSPEGGGLSGHA